MNPTPVSSREVQSFLGRLIHVVSRAAIYSLGTSLSRTRLGVIHPVLPPPTYCYKLYESERGYDGMSLSERGRTNQSLASSAAPTSGTHTHPSHAPRTRRARGRGVWVEQNTRPAHKGSVSPSKSPFPLHTISTPKSAIIPHRRALEGMTSTRRRPPAASKAPKEPRDGSSAQLSSE